MEEKIRKEKIKSETNLAHCILQFGSLFGGIWLILLVLAIWIFGFATEPVFFRDGKFVQIVDTREPLIVEKPITVTKTVTQITPAPNKPKNTENEILKLAYCLQSLQPKMSIEVAQIIARHTIKECGERDINVSLWVALMFSESSLDPMKSSPMGAHGLSQIRYVVWKEQPELLDNGVSVKDKLFWIDLNIKCGTTIFKKFYEESGRRIGVALWRYNSGQTKLPEGKRAHDIDYVTRIMYYTYKVNEIMAQESVGLHTINDSEITAITEESVVTPAAPAPASKEKVKKPATKHD